MYLSQNLVFKSKEQNLQKTYFQLSLIVQTQNHTNISTIASSKLSKDKKRMNKDIKNNNEEDESMNFDDNYNEQQFLKGQNGTKKVQKLTIMNDFGQLCQKLHFLTQQDREEKQSEDTLAQYYAKCKEKNTQKLQTKKQKIETQKPKSNQGLISKNSKLSPSQHSRSMSDNNTVNPQINRLQMSTHERYPSYGQNIKKPLQQSDLNENKRNYSSVEQKKKILQPSKNLGNPPNHSMKDYFGQQNNFVNRKVHGKNFINKQPKMQKEDNKVIVPKRQKQNMHLNSQKVNKENNLKQSNLIKSINRCQTLQNQKKSKISEKYQQPKIILYKKVIDLTQCTEALMKRIIIEQKKSDYEIQSQNSSTIQQGLFGKAIENKRALRTVQTVQSPNYNYLQSNNLYKEQYGFQKQYIASPLNVTHSPNPTNMHKSIFQKKETYR